MVHHRFVCRRPHFQRSISLKSVSQFWFKFHVKHHQGLGIGCIRFFVPNINPANQAPGFQTGLAEEIKNFYRLIMGFFLVKIFFSETKRPLAYIFNIYCAYRNSVNIAFLRLFRFVRTDRTMTIRIKYIYTPPNW